LSEYFLKDLAKTISSGSTPLRSNEDFWFNGIIPWLKTEQLGKSKYIYDTTEKISQIALEQTSLKVNPVNTLSIALYGEGKTRGNISILKQKMTTNQACCNIVIDEQKANHEFVYYFLKTQYCQLRNISSGIRKNLNSNYIKDYVVRLPKNISDQQKIAAVLSYLDDKIELNNTINAELESMAKMLYDYWFVQFDFPNKNGKPYKSSGGKMVFDEILKRDIPEGWEVKELSDIANITMGQSPPGDSYNETEDGEMFFQGCTDFGWRFPHVRQYTTKPSRRAKAGDILLSVRAPVGTLNIADNDCCIGRGLAALRSKYGFNSYLFYVMQYFKRTFDHRNGAGTTFGSITKDDLFSLKLVHPPKELLAEYNSIVSGYNKITLNNHKQNQQLTELRDWLLPMLMNGQVTVK
jgi:type I restriction enzyme S subunit